MKGFLVTAFVLASQIGFAKYGIVPTKFGVVPNVSSVKRPALAGAKLLYYGGPVISNARVVAVYWGNRVNQQVRSEMGSFYSALVDSNHMDWMDQYSTFGKAVDGRQGTNQHIGRGSFVGDFTITPHFTKAALDDKEIQAEIAAQVNQHVLPAPDANTVYMVHFPAGITISIEGMKSCVNFCAYHNAAMSARGAEFFYGVMPDLYSGACSFGCGGGAAFDATTSVSSHELLEAVTDAIPTPGDKPVFPQAWNTNRGEEVADLCPYGNGTLVSSKRTYKISAEWDNRTGTCNTGTYQSKF